MDLIEFSNIAKEYKKKVVLKGVSFNVKSGEVFGIAGSSGCGKTTLLKILIGMLKADSGRIFFEDKDALKKMNYLRKNTGFATQDNMLFNELTVKENVFYFGGLYGIKRTQIKEKFSELLKLLRLSGFEDTQINHLSGGMVKRANILVSLIHSPKLLVLDEPTVGLDPLLRVSLWNYIQGINKTGTTILVTSHLLEELEQNCDRIAIMKNGGIFACASPKDYKEKYGKNKTFNDIFQELVKNENA